jgi:hypothetical protein
MSGSTARVLVSAALWSALPSSSLTLVHERVNIELNPASLGLCRAGMGTGTIRKRNIMPLMKEVMRDKKGAPDLQACHFHKLA